MPVTSRISLAKQQEIIRQGDELREATNSVVPIVSRLLGRTTKGMV